MIQVRTRKADPQLRSVVRGFTERRAHLLGAPQVKPLLARPDQFLEFYLREPYLVRLKEGRFEAAPPSVLVGPTLSPVKELGLAGEVETFTIHFQPTGFARLFRLPMSNLADLALPAKDVLRGAAEDLESSLRRLDTFEERIRAAEVWLLARLERARPAEAVDLAALLLARSGGRARISALADRVDLSPRQLQRRFLEEVGVSPKAYARLHRFAGLLETRRLQPWLPWADLACMHGYADQAHLVREFQQLAGQSPLAALRRLEPLAEVRVS